MPHYDKIPALLDHAMTCSMAEAARRVGISHALPWHWSVQSRLGHPELQEITWCGVTAPYHVQLDNLKLLSVQAIEQSAVERALNGCYVDVFFQGQRQHESVLKPEYEGHTDEELSLIVGPDWRTECYETRPTKQWLKPSDALVVKVLESWKRKRYGAHQTIDVQYGGVLRLEKDAKPAPAAIEATAVEVFDGEAEDAPEQQGGHLALAAPAKSSEEFEERAASGEFDQATVTFKDADGKPAALRPDIEELRRQAAELKAHGPVHKRPEGKVEIFRADEPDKAVVAEDEEPEPQTLADHPRAYMVDKLTPYRGPPGYTKGEAAIGTGREGLGRGPDPSRIGKHIGFRVTQR